MGRRLQRLEVLFRQEVSDLLRRELRDPRLAEIITVTRVEVTADLQFARVYVSVLGEQSDKVSTMTALTAAAPFIRRQLTDRLTIRRVPALHFFLDESMEEAAHVLELLKGIRGGEQ